MILKKVNYNLIFFADEKSFYIGLKVEGGVRVWSDGSNLGYSALVSLSNDLSLDCIVMDSSAAAHGSSWTAQQCSESSKALCTGMIMKICKLSIEQKMQEKNFFLHYKNSYKYFNV